MAFEACRNPSVGFADSSPASGGAFNSLSQTFGLPAPSVREVDRLQYEVQHRPKKKDNVNTGV